MAPRPQIELQAILDALLPEGKRAYFQPPSNQQMEYPCIVYRRSAMQIDHADNVPYKHARRYSLTVIDWDAESEVLAKVEALPTVSFDRHYADENLNHDVYNIFF